MAECAAVFIGIARGAYELFLERLPGRGITYTDCTDQKLHPLTQIQVATAANKIDAAEALSARWLTLLQERADAGEQPTDEEKAIVRGQTGFAAQLAKEALEILHNAGRRLRHPARRPPAALPPRHPGLLAARARQRRRQPRTPGPRPGRPGARHRLPLSRRPEQPLLPAHPACRFAQHTTFVLEEQIHG
jgi:hypothetical protein